MKNIILNNLLNSKIVVLFLKLSNVLKIRVYCMISWIFFYSIFKKFISTILYRLVLVQSRTFNFECNFKRSNAIFTHCLFQRNLIWNSFPCHSIKWSVRLRKTQIFLTAKSIKTFYNKFIITWTWWKIHNYNVKPKKKKKPSNYILIVKL